MKRIISIIMALCLILCASVLGTACKKDAKEPLACAYVLAEKGDTYSLGLANSFTRAFEDQGGKVIMETFPEGTTGFSDYLKKAKEANADVIFAPNSAVASAALLKNAVDLEITVPILAGDTWESTLIQEAVKDTDLTVYYSTFFDESANTEESRKFAEGFKAFVNANSEYYDMNGQTDAVNAFSALGFDAYNAAMSAIRICAETVGEDMTSVDIATALWSVENKGVTGKITFDSNGDAVKDSAYIKKHLNDGSGSEFIKVQTHKLDSEKGSAAEYEGEGISIDRENKKIIIGVFEPITGDFAVGGKQEIVGIRYAHSLDNTLEIEGQEYSVELYVMDNASDEENAVAVAGKIVEGGAVITLGSYGSDICIAATPVFEEAMMPAIGVSCTNPKVTEDNDFYFRVSYLDSFQGYVMADFALSLVTEKTNEK